MTHSSYEDVFHSKQRKTSHYERQIYALTNRVHIRRFVRMVQRFCISFPTLTRTSAENWRTLLFTQMTRRLTEFSGMSRGLRNVKF